MIFDIDDIWLTYSDVQDDTIFELYKSKGAVSSVRLYQFSNSNELSIFMYLFMRR